MYLLNVKISPLSKPALLSRLLEYLEDGNKHHLVTTNPEFILEAQVNEPFRNVINVADLSLIDGVGILTAGLYASRAHISSSSIGKICAFIGDFVRVGFFHRPVTYNGEALMRITGVDLVLLLVQQEWMKGRKIYLLGGEENVSSLALRRLQQINPDIIFRSSQGVRNIRKMDEKENTVVLSDITHFSPDVLLVAYGHPWQDLWISHYKDTLNFKIAVGVGGTFDYLAGKVPRAPLWMRKLGLEWLYRLIKQPRRFGRIKRATWDFMQLIVRSDTIFS